MYRSTGMGGRVRGVLLAAAAASLAAFALAPQAGAQDEPAAVLPDSFGGAASAQALGASVLTPALVPVEGLFDLGFVEGRGTYERSNQEGRASLVFPGNGGISGPSLLCGTFLGPSIPPEGEVLFGPILATCAQYEYPLAVYVDSLSPDGATDGGLQLGEAADPISLGAVGAQAHAGIDATTTNAEVSDLSILGLPAIGGLGPVLELAGLPTPDTSLAGAESMVATTDQRIVGSTLVVDARATVGGLRLLGGLVRIGSIDSHSHIEASSGQDPVITTDLEVSGVEVAGMPAQITEDGLVVPQSGASSGPILQQVVSQVASALQSTGLKITTLAEEEGESNGIPFAGVGGLLIEYSTPLAGLPPIPGPLGDVDVNGAYGVRLQVGTTGVRGFADAFDDAPPVTSAPSTPSGGGGGSAIPSSGGGGSGGGGGGGGSSTPAAPSASMPTTSAATPAAAEPAGFLDDLFADRLGFLYLSFTLTALALCLAPRLSLPARLPAARA